MMVGFAIASLVALAAPAQSPDPAVSTPAVDEVVVTVGGRAVRGLCTGVRPRVLLLHDAGADAGSWRGVLDRLPPGVTACAYDRPAYPAAGSGASSRGWYELLAELVAIHDAFGAAPDVVLVGQGAGALYAALFAAARPQAVGGLVLIEPVLADEPKLLRQAMPEEDWALRKAARAAPNADGVRASELAARAGRDRLPRVPITVITAAERPVPPGWDGRFVEEATRRAHEALVRGRPFGRHVPARGAGPDVAGDAPAWVEAELERVLRIAGGP